MPYRVPASSLLRRAAQSPEDGDARAARERLASYKSLIEAGLNAWLQHVPEQQHGLLRQALWPGRRVRSSLLLALADESLAGSESSERRLDPSAIPLAVALELLHRASIVADDMIDGDSTRRLSPALHVAESPERASACVHILISSAFCRLSALGGPVALITADTYSRMASAQLAELDADFVLASPLNYYKLRVLPKTSAFFGAVFEMAGSLRHEPVPRTRARNIGERLGRLYQMHNDYYDVALADVGVRGWKYKHRLTVDLVTAVASEGDFLVRQLLTERRSLSWRQRRSVTTRLEQTGVLSEAQNQIAAEHDGLHKELRNAPPMWRSLVSEFAVWLAQPSFWDHRELELAGY